MNKRDFCFTCLLLLLTFVFFIPAQAYEESQLQWAQGTSAKLQRGDVLTYNGYTIEAVMFPSPVESDRYNEAPAEPVEGFVGVNISKNGVFISKTTLMLGDFYILPDGELRVIAKTLPARNGKEWLYESYTPWAVIEVNPRGIPDLQILIDTDEEKYVSSPSNEIVATLYIENSGQADLTNVDVDLETPLELKRGVLKYHYEIVKKGEAITETIIFHPPIIQEQKMYKIVANVTGFDVKDLYYSAISQKDITITIEPERGLSLRKTTFSKLYLKDTAMVTLSLKNNGKETASNVTIKDSIPKEFKLIGNKTFNWIIDLPAGGEWTYRYLVKPVEANKDGILFPSATADYKIGKETYGIRSNQPKVRVNGPKIVLSKKTDVSEIDINETVNILKIMVTAENTGNTPTQVFINDKLPENATIIEGNNTYEAFLEAGKKISYDYTVQVDSAPPFIIPSANADYFELGTTGMKISTKSQELEIKVKKPEIILPEPTPEIIPTPDNEFAPIINGSLNNTNSSENKNSTGLFNILDTILSSFFSCKENSLFFVCNSSDQNNSVSTNTTQTPSIPESVHDNKPAPVINGSMNKMNSSDIKTLDDISNIFGLNMS